MHGNLLVQWLRFRPQHITNGCTCEDFWHVIMPCSPILLRDGLTPIWWSNVLNNLANTWRKGSISSWRMLPYRSHMPLCNMFRSGSHVAWLSNIYHPIFQHWILLRDSGASWKTTGCRFLLMYLWVYYQMDFQLFYLLMQLQ